MKNYKLTNRSTVVKMVLKYVKADRELCCEYFNGYKQLLNHFNNLPKDRYNEIYLFYYKENERIWDNQTDEGKTHGAILIVIQENNGDVAILRDRDYKYMYNVIGNINHTNAY